MCFLNIGAPLGGVSYIGVYYVRLCPLNKGFPFMNCPLNAGVPYLELSLK